MASFAARVPFMNPSSNGGQKRTSWNDSQGGNPNPSKGPPASSNDTQFPHIKDIIASAQPKFDPSISLAEYLGHCEQSLQVSKTSISFGKPDHAFREFLKASEIAINIIPKHKDYGFLEFNDAKWSQRYKNARQVVTSMQIQMEGVRKIIEDNNTRHGTQQKSTTSGNNAIAGAFASPVSTRPLSQLSQVSSVSSTAELPDPLQVGKKRPVSHAKPDHLKSTPVAHNDLSQRFAQLRTTRQENRPTLEMPDASNFQSNPPSRASTFGSITSPNGASRPQGPRDMLSPTSAPSIPPKLPIADMPRPPDAAYNISQSARSSHDGRRPPTEKKQSYYGQPIASTSNPHLARYREETQPYRPTTPNGVNNAIIPKSNSAEIPHDRMISAETLANYRTRYNVLVVDIRSRESFDEGHIMATSVICIEPLALKEGTSADQLEERLVLSPENEQALFARRNEFDLVVYYDQDTPDTGYLRGNPATSSAPHLRAFYDTLHEFNEYKPLKDGRPPALLKGGLNAWIDMVGVQSLATSRTAATLGSTRQRPGMAPARQRTLTRARIASANSRFEIRDRRLRNHQFLDEKELQAWRQQALQERVVIEEGVPLSDGEYVEMEDEEEAPPSPYIPDYETFLRRFPAMEQQSMMVAPRRPVVPPKRFVEPLQMPAIPARPPPAIPRPSYSGQNEITPSQAPLARVTSSTRQPLYSSTLNLRSRKLPRTGLTNFGVTCYMNSTLQCLSSTIPLANFFMDQSTYQRNVQIKNWKGSYGVMPEIFANVLRSLWKGDVDMIKPTTFRNFCGKQNREWGIDRQQDAKEFFDFLVDCLHEDLNIAWDRTKLKPLTTEQELQRERYKITEAAPIEWQRYEHRDRSFISSLFAGQHASRLRCLTCHNTSTTYEAFYSISIEIPKSGQGDIYRCLESYTQEEKLDEPWHCPYCKVERQATKQIILTRLPTFLVIHFKRFSASKTESARKIHTPIEFPLQGLNMDRYVLTDSQPQTNGHVNGGAVQDPNTHAAQDMATTPPFSYDAYSVLRHLGNSGDSGHYISLVRDQGRGCWRKFDDERHYDFDPAQLSPRDRLQNGEAYIVFFQRNLPR